MPYKPRVEADNSRSYPLAWPHDQPRSSHHIPSPFKIPFVRSRDDLLLELRRFKGGVKDVIISTNIKTRLDGLPLAGERQPTDPGVAVYFKRKGQSLVIACDQYGNVTANLRAVGLTLKALRDIERYGSSSLLDRAFTGFALPAHNAKRPWYEVLGVSPDAPTDFIKAAYRDLARQHHPDASEHTEAHQQMAEINAAWDEVKALRQFTTQ